MIPANGAYDSKTEALLNAVSPSYVAITCSEKNPASAEVLGLLSQKNINTFSTTNGSIKITSDGSEIIIEQ
jgi:beta-lactamase superfamily II metal-dependent hydrolase